jgi:hypothetical protein
VEEVQILLDRTVAVGTLLARLGKRTSEGSHLILTEITDKSLADLYELNRIFVKLLEVVGGEVLTVVPVEAHPSQIIFDGIYVLDLFLAGVGIVKAQITQAAVVSGDPEINAHGLGMADVEIAVGLGRKPCVNPAAVLAGPEIVLNDRTDKIEGARFLSAILTRVVLTGTPVTVFP